MRGKVSLRRCFTFWRRITPAHAGKSASPCSCSDPCGDHPRPCGEKFNRLTEDIELEGSPPPMRGKAVRSIDQRKAVGITPAHAGKSRRSMRATTKCKDHPRPCGEKTGVGRSVPIMVGSPPPMRGKVHHADMPPCRPRITPAHAGKSKGKALAKPCGWDHPRPCGEKSSYSPCLVAAVGSPPPMRGKGILELTGTASIRITPAHAGKSLLLLAVFFGHEDHPRPCGEKC